MLREILCLSSVTEQFYAAQTRPSTQRPHNIAVAGKQYGH